MIRKIEVVFVCVMMVLLVAYTFGAFNHLFPEPDKDHASFWHDIVTSMFGALVGFRLALIADRWQKRDDDDTRKINLCKALKEVFGRNVGYLRGMRDYFKSSNNGRPSFLCDVVSLNALIPLRCELLVDTEIRQLIDHAHFELSHVNRRIEITFNSSDQATKDGTLILIEGAEKACQDAIEKVDNQMRIN